MVKLLQRDEEFYCDLPLHVGSQRLCSEGLLREIQELLCKVPNKKAVKAISGFADLTDTEKRSGMFGSDVEDQAMREASAGMNNQLKKKRQKLSHGNTNYICLFCYLRRCL